MGDLDLQKKLAGGEKEVELEGEPIPFPLPFKEGRQGEQGPLQLPGGMGMPLY